MIDTLTAYSADLHSRRLAAKTIRVRLIVARTVVRCYDLATVTSADLQAFAAQRWASLSVQTHSSYVQHCRDLFAWAQRAGLREDNPALDLPKPRVPRRSPRPISEDSLRLALCRANPAVRVWLILGAWAGLRCCEMAALDAQDVLDGALHVRGKGGHERMVPVGPALLRELHRYRMPRTGPIFRTTTGHRFTADAISARINEHLHELGLPDTAHALRHRYATQMYQRSRDIRMVQSLLGHASPTTTAIYTGWSRPQASRFVSELDAGIAA